MSFDFVSIDKAASEIGTTRKAIERKIEKAHWIEGDQWFKAPDGTRWISMKGVEKWVIRGASSSGLQASKSLSRVTEGRKNAR